QGKCKAILEGHTDRVEGAIELRSGDILSWSDQKDKTLRLWSPDGGCIAVLKGHTYNIRGVIELRSGDILSWSLVRLRLWSPEGKCKAILEGHTGMVNGAKELRSGDILSWTAARLRLWSPDGSCKAVLEGHTDWVFGAIELSSGDILSRSADKTLRLWTPDGICKEVIEPDNPQYDSYYALFHPKQVHDQFYVKESWGIELQHAFKPIVRWNSPSCHYRFLGDGRLCVWYGSNLEFLQLNYGNHMSVSFDQAHQLLAGEIDESKLVTYVPEPKGTAISESE
ncbi:MAG: hypothetical protein IKS45_07515, partial [Thermoguttaceae bacterium]|nr:hypothetical protein [Thermoguttaceae bacterium]